MTQESLVRSLSLRDATALVVGTIIGTGVFLKTAVMAQQATTPELVLAAWAAAGILSFMGALCYAELGAMFPRAGGEYVFMRQAWGDLPGFLYGWMRFWIGSPGSIAAYGVGTATFLGGLLPIVGDGQRTLVAIGVVATFTGLNCLTVAFGGRLQSALTALKIIMIFGLTIGIFAAGTGTWANLEAPSTGGWPGMSAFGACMLAALWAFDGWNNMPMAAGEIKDPGRNVPRALMIGVAFVLGVYALTNLAYFYALPFHEVATSSSTLYPEAPAVAARAAASVFGATGAIFLSAAFVLSAVGAMNGSILTSARVPFAMARDGLFFKKLGEVSHKTRVPVVAVLVQGIWACVLAMSGTFDQLTDYVVFSSWIFYALATAGIIVLRRKMPHADRPYRVPGYPFVPIVFVILSVLLLGNTLYTSPRESGIGLGLILLGVPVYAWFKRRSAV